MNLPNKLTLLRALMVPVFVFFMLFPTENVVLFRILACAVFCVASFTDFLDGYIARKEHLVTNFGKFMDPLADKLLVSSALICMVPLSYLPAWYVIVLIAREFVISGFRLFAAEQNVVIAASYFGKFKTACQMVMIILLILQLPALEVLTKTLVVLSFILTIVSLLDYLYKNRSILQEGGF